MSSIDDPDDVGRRSGQVRLVTHRPASGGGCETVRDRTRSPDDRVLVVSTRPPDRVVTDLTDGSGPPPAAVGVVHVGPAAGLSGASATDTDTARAPPSLSVETASLANPTRLGVGLVAVLGRWGSENGRITVCFECLDEFAQCVSPAVLVRFLRETVEQIRRVGARAHFHLAPAAVDDRTFARIAAVLGDG